jgi:NAD(P)-dependent dehydrogenase (short-subunit alcohol dehydrogenase family)
MKEFKDRVAVVTGAGSGIGLGIARALAARGMKLVLSDLNEETLASAVADLSQTTSVVGRACNVAELDAVQALADYTMETYGAVHVLCNNAGIGLPTSATRMKLEDWKWIIDVDLWGPIYGVKVFLPLIEMQEEGHVSSTSSMAGLLAAQMMGAYNVAKHGVIALMASLERELRARDSAVRASVLCPGPINTNISRNSVSFRPGQAKPKADGARSGKLAKNIQASLEQGMQPNEVGELVANAIENDKFWILTHPHWAKGVQRQLDALRDDQTLTRV